MGAQLGLRGHWRLGLVGCEGDLEEAGLGRVRKAQLGWLSSLHLVFFNRKQEKKKERKRRG